MGFSITIGPPSAMKSNITENIIGFNTNLIYVINSIKEGRKEERRLGRTGRIKEKNKRRMDNGKARSQGSQGRKSRKEAKEGRKEGSKEGRKEGRKER